MSKADDMFEEVGYIKSFEDNYEMFSKTLFDGDIKTIVFNINKGLIDIRTDDLYNIQVVTSILDIQELKAINEKIKELRVVR